jgi:small ligand-binding sensory domain FIST
MSNQIRWANALSTRPSLEAAVEEVVERAEQSLQASADLALVFISAAFASEYTRLMPLLQERLSVKVLIGCSGSGVIGMSRYGEAQEVEGQPGLSLTLLHLPDVNVHTFHLLPEVLPDLDSSPDTWVNLIGVAPETRPHFILFSDPFLSGINDLLEGLDFAYPGAIKLGGLASGGNVRGNIGLFCNYKLHREGTVGVAFSGNFVLETIVAQGCRPIGETYRVTKGERNIVLGLEEQSSDIFGNDNSRPPLEVLRDLLQNLSDTDRLLAQNSLFVGVARDEFKQELQHGDFLIRNLLGVDPKAGAIAIGDRVRPGQRIKFHLRDSEASADDLEMMLQRYLQQTPDDADTIGALMFPCVGRGEGLYGRPNFDSQMFRRYLKNVPISGFFCNGEIGPVGSGTFLHGYTSVFGICRQP